MSQKILRDKVIIYDQTYNPAVTGAILPGNTADLPVLNAAEHGLVIEEMWVWPSYTVLGLPADLAEVLILINGVEYPSAPGRLKIRAMADRNMATPFDQRYANLRVPLGKISLDPLEDTTLKVTPSQNISIRLRAGVVAGLIVTDSPLRVMLVGRIADSDMDLQLIYGGTTYQPFGSRQLGDPITEKVTKAISKTLNINIENLGKMSGGTNQSSPKIFPFWAWGVNAAVIPSTPEFEWTFTAPPGHVARAEEDLSFDWSRTTSEAILIDRLAAYINVGRGLVWFHQPPIRRPGHKSQFFGWVVNAAFPNLLPGGGVPALAGVGMMQGPIEIMPRILAYNNLTQVRAAADAGTTILAGNLEIQLRGIHVQF